MLMDVGNVDDESIILGLRHAETIRNLDAAAAMKIALALAGTYPALFDRLVKISKTQNVVAPSTLKLSPVPSNPTA
jgi:hypothetical protein